MTDRHIEKDPPLTIVLVEPKIPPNTGNIARLSAATGCRLVLLGELGFSIDDKAVRRAGLDYWPHVDVLHEPDTNHLARNRSPTALRT